MRVTPGSPTAGPRQAIDGVLLLDKSSGITSNSALQCAKRLLQASKVGHVGTLDPLASGLLPLCFGEATKFSGGMFLADKSYLAEVALGLTTTTGDAEGEVLSRSSQIPELSEIEAVLPRFIGSIMQTPPLYSALKRNGKPLYAYARAGEKIEIKPRPVLIHEIRILSVDEARLQLHVRCGKGTYIRTLAEDIGQSLGCGASLSGLRRTTVGAFEVAGSVGLEQLTADTLDQRRARLLPLESLVVSLPEWAADAEGTQRLLTGRSCAIDTTETRGWVRLYDPQHRFLGLGEILAGVVVPRRLRATGGYCPDANQVLQTHKSI